MQSKRGLDWCHLCGITHTMRFVQFDVPKNAEHSTKDSEHGSFRFCEQCVGKMQEAIESTPS